jgi:hypothetical protein
VGSSGSEGRFPKSLIEFQSRFASESACADYLFERTVFWRRFGRERTRSGVWERMAAASGCDAARWERIHYRTLAAEWVL